MADVEDVVVGQMVTDKQLGNFFMRNSKPHIKKSEMQGDVPPLG